MKTTRRRFVIGAAGASAALLLNPRRLAARAAAPPTPLRRGSAPLFGTSNPTHLAWVWQFRHDGDLAEIRDTLAAHNLGIVLKTHDGTEWMSTYDPNPDAVSGPDQVLRLAAYFENGGVPFHTWCVVHGLDPIAEADMAASVLGAGARSLAIDVEPHAGFWRGTPEAALQYGESVRRRFPDSVLITSVDARPWEIDNVPLEEFASFTDAFAPQVYWAMFSTMANLVKFKKAGDDPGPAGMTARFAVDSAARALERYGLPVIPIGDGTVEDGDAWREFIDESFARSAPAVSVWRFGVTSPAIWELLRDVPPPVPVVAETSHTVVDGDTLSAIAEAWGTSVDAVVQANGLANPNMLSIGQVLQRPGAVGPAGAAASTPAPASGAVAAPGASVSSGRTYVVEAGDSLWDLALAWGTTPEAIAGLNGITDPSRLQIGQVLLIPS